MERKENTQYVLSLSYGKDSLATIEACRRLGYPIDRIVHAEVWATDDIPADLPPMVEFKKKADEIIKERYGIEVEHVCAMRDGEKLTYEKLFYTVPKRKSGGGGTFKGFPGQSGFHWCVKLKTEYIRLLDKMGPSLPLIPQKGNTRQIFTDSLTRAERGSDGAGASNFRRSPLNRGQK